MRNLKKVLSLVLVFALVLSLASVAGASSFPDVASDNVYADAIDLLASLNILGGYEDGTFKADNNITRAELSKVLYVVYEGADDVTATMFAGTSSFNDVKSTDWFSGHVNWAVNNGVVHGYGDGTFLPSNNVKLKEAITMVVGSVTDKELSYPNGYVQEAKSRGILDGVTLGSIEDNATRGQVAQMAYNLLYTPSKLCMEPKKEGGKIQYNDYGEEIYQSVKPIEFVFGLNSIGDPTYLDTNTYGDYIATVDTEDDDATVPVTFVGSYDNVFTSTLDMEEGQVALNVDGTEVVVDYDGDVTNLYGQNVTVYYKSSTTSDNGLDKNDTILSLIPTGTVLTTTKDKLVGSGSTYKVDGTKISLPSSVDYTSDGTTLKAYFFRQTFVQQAEVTNAGNAVYTNNNNEGSADGTNSGCIYTGYFTSSAKPSNDIVKLIDVDNDGVYERLIVEQALDVEITAVTSAAYKFKNATNTDVTGTTTVDKDLAVGATDLADGDYATVTYAKNADGDYVYTFTKATTVTGVLSSISSSAKTVSVDGTTYTGATKKSIGYAANTYNDSMVFNKVNDLVGEEVTLYLNNLGYVIYVDGESITDYKLNLAVVKAATDDQDRNGDISASLTLLLPDGTEKTLNIATASTVENNSDISATAFPGDAAAWKTIDTDNNGKTMDEYFWDYTQSKDMNRDGTPDNNFKDFAIVGEYIHYEEDEDTGYATAIVAINDIGKSINSTGNLTYPTNADDDAILTVDAFEANTLCYDKTLGYFYTLKSGKGSAVKASYDVADDFVGMYYSKDPETGVVTTEYYTASTIPNFELKGEYTLVENDDGDVVAMVVGTSASDSVDTSVLGIITEAVIVKGESDKLSSGANAYRVQFSVDVGGKTATYYTKDMDYSKLPNTSKVTSTDEDDMKDKQIVTKRLVYINLDSNGKVATTTTGNLTYADLTYIGGSDMNWGVMTAIKGTNRVTITPIQAVKTSVKKGYTEDADGNLIYADKAQAGYVTSSGPATQEFTCDETTVLLYNGNAVAETTEQTFTTLTYLREMSKFASEATVETLSDYVCDDWSATDDNYTAYVVAYTLFAEKNGNTLETVAPGNGEAFAREADDDDNYGCIDTIIVFQTAVDK